MRKFTYKDIRDWKVIGIDNQELVLIVKGKDGVLRNVTRFDGYRSANQAATRLGGFPVRA